MSEQAPSAILITTGTMLRAIALAFAIVILWSVRDILLSVFTALLLAGLLYPAAQWAVRHKIPRPIAVLACYALLFGALIAIFVLLIPALLDQARQLLASYGKEWGDVGDVLEAVRAFTAQYNIQDNLAAGVVDVQAQAGQAAVSMFGLLSNVFGGIVNTVVVIVLSFYMLMAEDEAKGLFRSLIPARHQEVGAQLIFRVVERLGSWLRGQLVLGLVIGVLVFVAYTVIGVPYALLLAILAALLEFVPYAGPFLAALPAVFLALTVSPLHAVATLVAFIILQQTENHVLVPLVMKRAVGLNPVVSIVAFLIGARLFGIVGAVFAIPVATAASVVFEEWMRSASRGMVQPSV